MVRKVSIAGMSDEVRRFFQELAVEEDFFLVVEEGGNPVAGIVPAREVEDRDRQRELLMDMLRRVWSRTKDMSPDEIEREVEEAVQEYRREARA